MSGATAKVDAWMPLWIGDILAETMGLTRDLIGGYMLLLFAYWRNKGPLPDDDESFAAIVRASVNDWRERLRPRLVPFFVLQASVWHHERTDLELAKAGRNKAVAVEKARKAAAGRWHRTDAAATASTDAPSMPDARVGACLKVTPSPSPSPSSPSALRSEGESANHRQRGPKTGPAIPGVPPALVADWIEVRKAKRAGALTSTAVAGLLREAAKASITPEEAVRWCCEAGWQGFRADWYLERAEQRRDTGARPPSRYAGAAAGVFGSGADRTVRRMETLAELTGQAPERDARGGCDVVVDIDARIVG